MEQNEVFKNRATHIWRTRFRQKSKANQWKKKKSFQQIAPE